MNNEIEATREKINQCERNVEAQRWRVAALEGNRSAKWLAEQLLAGSEEQLRRHQEHLEDLLNNTRRSGATEREHRCDPK